MTLKVLVNPPAAMCATICSLFNDQFGPLDDHDDDGELYLT